nr:hypothetical protein B0A51_01712 [Rachicladosporium sp. CCFEE 5018]
MTSADVERRVPDSEHQRAPASTSTRVTQNRIFLAVCKASNRSIASPSIPRRSEQGTKVSEPVRSAFQATKRADERALGLFVSSAFCFGRNGPALSKETASPSESARPSIGHKRTFSGGSDRKAKESEQAHERLALERADYEKQGPSLTERRASVISQLQTQGTAPALQPTPVAEGTDPFDGAVEKHHEAIEPAKWNGHV